jgi:citronellol/citronellal dehydrogenase
MRERGQGWILNISSIAAVHPAIPPEPGADGIAVNVLSPTRGVPTPGVLFHHLITDVDQALASGEAESPEMFAEASLALCRGDPAVLTGRVAYSRQLVANWAAPRDRWTAPRPERCRDVIGHGCGPAGCMAPANSSR